MTRHFLFLIAAAMVFRQCGTGVKAGKPAMLTYLVNGARTGVQPNETVLTPQNVNARTFGKLFSLPVDGQVYAQPLYVSRLRMSDGDRHNVLYVATEHDSVYAFDVGGKTSSPLWQVSLLRPGEQTLNANGERFAIQPEIGVTGTPVIDLQLGVLYVVARSKVVTAGKTIYIQRLHALSLTHGDEELNGPTVITASVPGTAPDAVNGRVRFNRLKENQRGALLLANGVVWITWGSDSDIGPYHGWIMGYDASDISKQVAVFNDTPDGSQGGIWMPGGASTDGHGNLFAVSGNGSFNAGNGGRNYGMTVFKFAIDDIKGQWRKRAFAVSTRTAGDSAAVPMVPTDWFTPDNWESLSTGDWDMGCVATTVLPRQPGNTPDMLVTASKDGELFLVDRDDMGHFDKTANHILQSFNVVGRSTFVQGNPVFFDDTMYISQVDGPTDAYSFDPSTARFNPRPSSQTPDTFGHPGATPSISSNGSSNAILWGVDDNNIGPLPTAPATLRAYDATNLAHELYSSDQAPNHRDQPAVAVKFATPVVANGRVYVGGQNAVTVYGLLKEQARGRRQQEIGSRQ
jgi:hypothetical protein